MRRSKPEFDLCIIGGGSAGLVVAAGGAALGAKIVLVEKRALGGDCLRYGCVPSKALLHCAKVAETMRRAGQFGIGGGVPDVDLAAVMRRVEQVVRTIESHDSPERFRALGVEVIFGAGRFADAVTFTVNGRALTAKNFVLATGSRAAVPPVPGLDRVPWLTNESVFALREPVPSLIVLGGGPIGVEMAQAFARLGSRVYLVNRGAQILPKEDGDLARVVADRLAAEGVELFLGYSSTRVDGQAGDIRLWLKAADGDEQMVQATHLLVAAGRQANVEDLGLEQAGIALDKGRIMVDRRLRTTNRHVYGCGDVAGAYQFTHVAEHHAGVVLQNALFHLPARVEDRVIPWCTFTDPELARVGMSETEAKAANVPCRAYTFPFRDIDRAQADGETGGFAKILADPQGRLLGAAIVGPHAGELIHEYVLAMAGKMKLSSVSGAMHIYPTLAQINRRVADARRKQALTPAAKTWIKRLFGLRGA